MKKEYLIGIPILLLCVIIVFIATGNIACIDNTFYKLIVHKDYLTAIFKFLTNFGSTLYIVIFCIILFFIYKNKKEVFNLYGLILISTILNNVLKLIFKRPRPNLVHLVPENTYSFPSGHSMAAMTLYGFLIYLIWKSKIKKELKIASITALSLLILLIGFSRIYLNVHYFSDVIGGFCCSIILLYIFIKWTKIE